MNRELLKAITKDLDFTFKANTTYHLGGRAVCYYPKSSHEVSELLKFAKETNTNYFVLGNGSNVLASDKGFDGIVISTKLLNSIKLIDTTTIQCQAGVTVGKLLKFCLDNCLGGLEYLAGIPATIGGLAYMNGGAFNKYIGKDILSVNIVDDNIITKFDNKWCDFSYKHSTMSDINAFICSVELRVYRSLREEIEKNIRDTILKRKVNPKGYSCGCVFKNFDDVSAGKLIELAGLKGVSIGGASVSSQHANFIINNDASAEDVFKLIQLVKRQVYLKFQRELKEEVVYIGEFNETDR